MSASLTATEPELLPPNRAPEPQLKRSPLVFDFQRRVAEVLGKESPLVLTRDSLDRIGD
jgi:hypothetical protein